jgi:hypothetical protein
MTVVGPQCRPQQLLQAAEGQKKQQDQQQRQQQQRQCEQQPKRGLL